MLTVLVGFLLPALPPPAAQADSDAPRYLRQAIADFRAARPERARDRLSAARGLDRELIDRTPESRKLRGLLLLLEGRDREAMPEFLAYLKARPAATGSDFLWYLLGDYNLRHGDRSRAARAYFRAAQAARANFAPRPDSADGSAPTTGAGIPAWTALAPLACPETIDGDANRFWQAREAQPFDRLELTAALWDRSLGETEIAQAAFAALLYGSRDARSSDAPANASIIEETPPGSVGSESQAELRRIVAESLRSSAVRAKLGRPLAELMAAPHEAIRHRVCLQQLESLERRQIAAIQRGALTPARERLKHTREYLKRLHFARMSFFVNDLNSMYRYGVYMLRRGQDFRGQARKVRAIQALHALRRAFHASGGASSGASDAPNETMAANTTPAQNTGVRLRYDNPQALRIQAQILHRLAEAYDLLGRGIDRDTLARIALILAERADRTGETENANASVATWIDAEIGREAKDANDVRRLVFKRCGENFLNREALLILLGASAPAASREGDALRPPRTAEFYRAKLFERDQKFEEAELLSAFAP